MNLKLISVNRVSVIPGMKDERDRVQKEMKND
jgi:hypothetical protein